MAKTMAIFKAMVLVLALVPMIGASSVKELERKNEKLEAELAQLKEIVSVLQAKVDKKVDTVDFTANVLDTTEQMKKKVDVDDFIVKLNDTEELEARVTVLEESVADLEVDVVALTDEVDDVESVNILQDDRINTLEAEIFDNENDIEELVDITTGLTTQVTSLDQRVSDLESGGGGNGNVTDLEERVETLEEVTSQLTDDVSSLEVNDVTQDERISSIEEDVTSLDQRVEDLESSSGGDCNVTDYGDTAFLAALSTSDSSSANPVQFDWEVINPGGHYDPETGEYTVPYDGIYQFSVHMMAYSSSSTLLFYIYVDGSYIGSHVDGYYHEGYRSTTLLLELQAGQTVHIYRAGGAYGQSTYLRSYFSGYMISAN